MNESQEGIKSGWQERMTIRVAQLDQYIRGDRWRWLVRWLYKLMAPFYDWGADRLMPDYRQATIRLVDELAVTANDIVLDLGCGTGIVTVPACERARFTVGIDMTPEMLRQLQQKQRNGRPALVRGDVRFLPFTNQSFRVVATSFMLLHLTTAEKQQVFREVWRVLLENGRFGCLTGCHETGSAYPTAAEWQSWLEQSGFTNITVTAYRDVYYLAKATKARPQPK